MPRVSIISKLINTRTAIIQHLYREIVKFASKSWDLALLLVNGLLSCNKMCNNPVFFQWITKMKIHSWLFFSKISNERIEVRHIGREIRYIINFLVTMPMAWDIHWLHSEEYYRICDAIRSHKHGSWHSAKCHGPSGTLFSNEQVS
jgi:hypothetical protein